MPASTTSTHAGKHTKLVSGRLTRSRLLPRLRLLPDIGDVRAMRRKDVCSGGEIVSGATHFTGVRRTRGHRRRISFPVMYSSRLQSKTLIYLSIY
jgi:hypothetical protein